MSSDIALSERAIRMYRRVLGLGRGLEALARKYPNPESVIKEGRRETGCGRVAGPELTLITPERNLQL